MPAGSTDSNGVYQYGSSDSNATFDGLLNIAGAVLSTTIAAIKTRLTNTENSQRRIVASLSALDAISNAVVGQTAFVTAPGTGVEGHAWVAVAGSGAGLDWKPDGIIEVATKANLDTYIAAVIAISDLTFKVGGLVLVTGTQVFYRFTTSAGAYRPLTGLTPIAPTSVAGTGVTLGANGRVTASGATAISMMGVGLADFDTIRITFRGAGTAGANVTLRVRTGGADVSAANYNHVAIETTLSSGPTRSATTGDTAGGAARMDNGQGAGWLEVSNLFAATATTWQGASVDASTAHRTVAGRHTLATSYPDLTIVIGTGNFTGTIDIEGYTNN